MFCRNVGTLDRLIRVALGLILIALVFVGPQTLWGWIGILPLLSGLIGWCGLYAFLGRKRVDGERCKR